MRSRLKQHTEGEVMVPFWGMLSVSVTVTSSVGTGGAALTLDAKCTHRPCGNLLKGRLILWASGGVRDSASQGSSAGAGAGAGPTL